jgi:hypothetical protein
MNCRACGTRVPQPGGKHGAYRYCRDHRPVNAAAAHAYYLAHRAERLEYQRLRHGTRPLERSACAECGVMYRHYPGASLCGPCRRRERERLAPVADGPCLECSGPVPPYSGRNRRRIFCSAKCRQRADDRKRTPRNRTPKGATND